MPALVSAAKQVRDMPAARSSSDARFPSVYDGGECSHGCVLIHVGAGEAPLHEPAHGCVLIHVGAAQASIRKHHRIFAPSVLLESMQRKSEAHHVLGVMHQVGMCVWLDQQVEGASSAAHISCVPAAHPVACPSPT